jgi:hypothetical protein
LLRLGDGCILWAIISEHLHIVDDWHLPACPTNKYLFRHRRSVSIICPLRLRTVEQINRSMCHWILAYISSRHWPTLPNQVVSTSRLYFAMEVTYLTIPGGSYPISIQTMPAGTPEQECWLAANIAGNISTFRDSRKGDQRDFESGATKRGAGWDIQWKLSSKFFFMPRLMSQTSLGKERKMDKTSGKTSPSFRRSQQLPRLTKTNNTKNIQNKFTKGKIIS